MELFNIQLLYQNSLYTSTMQACKCSYDKLFQEKIYFQMDYAKIT